MNPDQGSGRPQRCTASRWLEHATALSLGLVLAALGLIVLAAYRPQYAAWLATEAQIAILLVLLTVALGLVSMVALLHTWS